MLDKLSLRTWYIGVFLACAGLMAFALYAQHKMFLDPCPLCIFQRIAFIWIGFWALLAAVHNPPGRGMRWFYGILVDLGATVGAVIAVRHIYLQNLPPDQVPDCGPGLSYMMETMPFLEAMNAVLAGDGSCAEIKWSFLGLSMPGWTLVWYLGFATITLLLVALKTRSTGQKL